jgi:hypothetical protein
LRQLGWISFFQQLLNHPSRFVDADDIRSLVAAIFESMDDSVRSSHQDITGTNLNARIICGEPRLASADNPDFRDDLQCQEISGTRFLTLQIDFLAVLHVFFYHLFLPFPSLRILWEDPSLKTATAKKIFIVVLKRWVIRSRLLNARSSCSVTSLCHFSCRLRARCDLRLVYYE